MLTAEVLSSAGDGTVMLAIGRHVVPADTDLQFEPGTSFLLRVEENGSDVVLRLLGDEPEAESPLLRALRGAVSEGRPLGELLGELRAALAQLEPPITSLARGLETQARIPESGALLKALIFGSGLAHEAVLAAVVQGRAGREELEASRDDLKARLIQALRDLPEGPVREAARHALAGLEVEQLLNLARQRMGEPVVLSLPFLWGKTWTTVRLQVPPRDSRGSEEEDSFRMAMGLELSQLGPVRADFVLAPSMLSVRVLVTQPDLAQQLQAQAAELSERMGGGHRRVQLHVREGTLGEVALGRRPLDIRFLRENHLMNVAG